ncbi:hypothetical protein [Bacillus sp. FJAT-26390]|uniref:hypothetical protein n=1 Tax=Bacillus sp. FJAT-26390 TaxID=1743142 RepID=UPI000807DE7E|nr:hypothetical protein [Bacillus sp. FJAT-26390]OBZ10908.1 hypothetical protein A7975_18070 [Bacillus sp. FJAT-26390]
MMRIFLSVISAIYPKCGTAQQPFRELVKHLRHKKVEYQQVNTFFWLYSSDFPALFFKKTNLYKTFSFNVRISLTVVWGLDKLE